MTEPLHSPGALVYDPNWTGDPWQDYNPAYPPSAARVAKISEQVRNITGIVETVVRMLPSATGDDGPQIQALYDAGAGHINLLRGQTYTIKTPVFQDIAPARGEGGLAIHLNGAKLVLDNALPQVQEWLDNPTYTNGATARVAFFPNTLRTALSAGVVTLAGNFINGGNLWLSIEGPGHVTGTNQTGLAMANNNGLIHCEKINGSVLFLIANGTGCDSLSTNHCVAVSVPSNSLGAMIWSFLPAQPGDTYSITDCKADTNARIGHFVQNRSVAIRGVNNGLIKFVQCQGILVGSAHYEANLGNPAGVGTLLFDCSSATFVGNTLKNGRGTQYLVEVNDTQPEPLRTSLLFLGPTFQSFISSPGDTGAGLDLAQPPHIRITAANRNTRIRAVALASDFDAGLDGNRRGAPGPLMISSAVTTITTALGTSQAKDAFANGAWELRQRGSGVWEVVNPLLPGLALLTKGVAPTATLASIAGANILGTLAISTQYAYAMATRDALGNYGPLAQVGAITTPGSNFTGVVRLSPTASDAPKTLCIWRQAAAATVTVPDHYIEIPCPSYSPQFYDTGANVQGIPWLTGGLVNTLPTVDASLDALAITDANDAGSPTLFLPHGRPRVETLPDAATVTPNSVYDGGIIAQLSQATTIANPLGTPSPFQSYVVRLASTVSRALTWGAQFRGSADIALPASNTGGGKWDYLAFRWNATDSKWDLVGLIRGF